MTVTRKTLHTAILDFVKTGNPNSLNRTLNQIHNKKDLEVLFQASANGFNVLHDVIRFSYLYDQYKYAVDNYRIVKQRLCRIFKSFNVKQRYSELLLGLATNDVSVFASALASGNFNLIRNVYDDIEYYCGRDVLKQQLMHAETTRTGHYVIFNHAIYTHAKPSGERVHTHENMRTLQFLTDKLRELCPCDADPFILGIFQNSEWFPSINSTRTTAATVDDYLQDYQNGVTRKCSPACAIASSEQVRQLVSNTSSNKRALSEIIKPEEPERKRKSRWDQPPIPSSTLFKPKRKSRFSDLDLKSQQPNIHCPGVKSF